jgi:hypothetical protein
MINRWIHILTLTHKILWRNTVIFYSLIKGLISLCSVILVLVKRTFLLTIYYYFFNLHSNIMSCFVLGFIYVVAPQFKHCNFIPLLTESYWELYNIYIYVVILILKIKNRKYFITAEKRKKHVYVINKFKIYFILGGPCLHLNAVFALMYKNLDCA